MLTRDVGRGPRRSVEDHSSHMGMEGQLRKVIAPIEGTITDNDTYTRLAISNTKVPSGIELGTATIEGVLAVVNALFVFIKNQGSTQLMVRIPEDVDLNVTAL